MALLVKIRKFMTTLTSLWMVLKILKFMFAHGETVDTIRDFRDRWAITWTRCFPQRIS